MNSWRPRLARLARKLRPDVPPPAKDIDNLTIIVPTYNSEKYLDLIIGYYRQHGIPVTVFIDGKSNAETHLVAAAHGGRVLKIDNPSPRIGEIVEPMSRSLGTEWVLRMDDDELPSLAMMDFIRAAIRRPGVDAYAFIRHQCAVSSDGRLLRSLVTSPYVHRQWRLYRRDHVSYTSEGHMPGFLKEGLRSIAAPDEAAMIHLDWAVHTYEERREKTERYDRHTPGDGSNWRAYYLPEDQPGHPKDFARLYFREFDELAEQLKRRRICPNIESYVLTNVENPT